MKRRYRCYNIKWDTSENGRSISPKKLGLPSETIIESDDPEFDPDTEGADALSDKFGFCVFGFEFEEVKA